MGAYRLRLYGTEVVILAEVFGKTIKTYGQLELLNDLLLMLYLDESEELQEVIEIRLGQYHQLATQHYKENVRNR